LTERSKSKRVSAASNRNQNVVSDVQARKTAVVVAAVLAAIALWNLYRGRMTQVAVFGSIAGLLLVIGLLVPAAARAFHRFWMGLAGILGYINSRILLSVLYYGVFTPVGFVRRLMGRDPMRRRAPAESSYWIQRETTRQSKIQFERLF
jgi:Saxitoxin biosynthesis operon protein SxtJ